jgi:hypothetical protein
MNGSQFVTLTAAIIVSICVCLPSLSSPNVSRWPHIYSNFKISLKIHSLNWIIPLALFPLHLLLYFFHFSMVTPHYSFCVVSSFSYSFNRMLTRDTDFFYCGASTFWAGYSVESYESFYRCIDTGSDEDQYDNSDSISSEQDRIPSKVIRLN